MRLWVFWSLVILALVFVGVVEVSHAYERPPPRKDPMVSLAEDAEETTPQQGSHGCRRWCFWRRRERKDEPRCIRAGWYGYNPLSRLDRRHNLLNDVLLSRSHSHDRRYPSVTQTLAVHVSLVGENGMRISWITDNHTLPIVYYGRYSGKYEYYASGTISSYDYLNYTSGEIHDVVIGPLEPNTLYYYSFAPGSTPEYSFKTPPAQFPIKFAISADLGQSEWTKSTLKHISQSNYDVFLLPGDLSYADKLQHHYWDSFGRLVETLASQRPWMVSQGDHEVEKIPDIHPTPFTAYNARWRMPFEESGSTSNLYYSFTVSGVHVIMLGSYTDFGYGSDQFQWLESDLDKVDRSKTPWLVVLVHAPWYNSYFAHQGETQSVDMMKSMEELLYKARVDVVIAGHIHAYERFNRVYNQGIDYCGPMYITIGDGGNHEGLHIRYKEPQPMISAFREASFGHGELEVVNGSHARWSWHRNDDDESVQSDSIWLKSLAFEPSCYT